VRPYFSPDDVAKGSRWSSEIAKELEEVLGLTRRLASDRERRFDLSHPVWDDLLSSALDLARVARARADDDETASNVRRLMHAVEYISRREMHAGRPSMRHVLGKFQDLLATDLKAEGTPRNTSDEAAV
jgi:hypothetical protein